MHPVATPPTIRPSGWWYLAAVGLAVLGCILSVVAVVRGFEDAESTALTASAAAPGQDQPLTLDRVGGYTIAYSGPIIAHDVGDQRDLVQELAISIVPAGGGDPLPLEVYDGFRGLEDAGQQYVPLLTVRIDEPGEYVLHSSLSPQVDQERSAVVLHESPFQRLRSGAERAVVLLVGGIGLGILVAVIIGRMRGRAKAAARAAAPSPWSGSSGGPGPWGGPMAPPAWGPPGQPPGPGAWPPR